MIQKHSVSNVGNVFNRVEYSPCVFAEIFKDYG